ncbi:hypothetical protein [Gordonia sp. DT218]|uniref:hypothetical protein n=1 Tax=Gordonia sp. DT218 TaxID=3416659 RepID=UPI003CEE28DA
MSDDSAWTTRAAAARAAARELDDCRMTITRIVGMNYFGRDCVEGLALYESLRRAIVDSGWSTQLVHQVNELNTLAANCDAAANSIKNQDEQEGRREFQN